MPYGNRRYRKKPYRKKSRRRYKKKAQLTRQVGAFSDAQIVKLRYVDRFTLDPNLTSTAGDYVFSANGLFDPNVTGIGHQPLGFDQWMAMYDHYTVLGSRATLQVVNNQTAIGDSLFVGISLKDESAADTTDFITVMEQNKAKTRLLSNGTGSATNARVSHNFSAKKFFHTDVKDRPDLRGTVAANPAEQAYYHCFASSLNGNDNPNIVAASITIEYIVLLTERQPLPGS